MKINAKYGNIVLLGIVVIVLRCIPHRAERQLISVCAQKTLINKDPSPCILLSRISFKRKDMADEEKVTRQSKYLITTVTKEEVYKA